MKTTIFRLFVIILMAQALVSCTDVIDPKIIGDPDTTPRLVVDALINDKSNTQDIYLTWSQQYFNNDLPKTISDATVKVRERNNALGINQEYAFTLDPSRPGHYIYNGLTAKEGSTYELSIVHLGQSYTASTFAPRRIKWIQTPGYANKPDSMRYDTLYFQYRKRLGPNPKDTGYAIQMRIADNPGLGDCYRLVVYRNNKQLNLPSNLNVYKDGIALDGRNFIPPVIGGLNPDVTNDKPFQQGDTVAVEIQCIDNPSYDFWLQVEEQINNGGLFANPPANVPRNIKNTTGGDFPLGWFGAATTLTRSAVIRRGVNVEVPE